MTDIRQRQVESSVLGAPWCPDPCLGPLIEQAGNEQGFHHPAAASAGASSYRLFPQS